MALPSQFAMLNPHKPVGERAKRSKLAKEMVNRSNWLWPHGRHPTG